MNDGKVKIRDYNSDNRALSFKNVANASIDHENGFVALQSEKCIDFLVCNGNSGGASESDNLAVVVTSGTISR